MTDFLINDNVHIVYLDNVIFHRLQRRLLDRNYGCRRRPRYLISANFHVVAKMRLAPGGFQCPSWQTLGLPHCRGPHRIAGPRAPRPHDPPLAPVVFENFKWSLKIEICPIDLILGLIPCDSVWGVNLANYYRWTGQRKRSMLHQWWQK